jgi:hypothetical protein
VCDDLQRMKAKMVCNECMKMRINFSMAFYNNKLIFDS